jgi:protein gp37
MNNTEIRWTELTWNPASGCAKVTAGCKHCYAETIAENKRGTPAFPNGFDLTIRPHKLREPHAIKEGALIFVNSMSDLFWEEIPDAYRDKVLDIMEETPRHQYQVLTKRPEVMLRYSKRRRLPANMWAGVTVENQECTDARLPLLLEVKAEIRFLSAEPVLGPIDLRPTLAAHPGQIHWVIFGGESGNHLTKPEVNEKRGLCVRGAKGWEPRPDRVGWAREMRDACVDNGVTFFFKQWGGPRSTSGGKLLDGRTWEQYPRLPGKTAQGRSGSQSLPLFEG